MAFPPVLFAILLIAVLGTGLDHRSLPSWSLTGPGSPAWSGPRRWPGAMDYVASAQVAGAPARHHAGRDLCPTSCRPSASADAGNGDRRDRRGDPVVREPVDLHRQPTWGGMIAEGRTSIHQAWWVLVFPLVSAFPDRPELQPAWAKG